MSRYDPIHLSYELGTLLSRIHPQSKGYIPLYNDKFDVAQCIKYIFNSLGRELIHRSFIEGFVNELSKEMKEEDVEKHAQEFLQFILGEDNE